MGNVIAEFFIPGNTPSSKNSRVWTGQYFIPSEATSKWIKKSKGMWISQSQQFRDSIKGLSKPYYIEFTFIRLTRRRFDYVNIAQAPLDAMVRHNWIDDDDMANVKPYFGDYIYDKNAPGLIIKILREKPKHYDSQTHNRTS